MWDKQVKAMLVDKYGNPISSEHPLNTSLYGTKDQANSTNVPLPGDDGETEDHIFVGEWFDRFDPLVAQFLVTVKADQQGIWYVERTNNKASVGKTAPISDIIELSEGQRYSDAHSARYFRVKFVNGIIAQTIFRLNTFHSAIPIGFSFQQLKQAQNDETMALNTIANLSGKRSDGARAYVPLDNADLLRVNSKQYTHAIAEGDVPGHFPISKFGANDSTLTTQTIVSDLAQATYPYLTAAEILQIVSSDVDDHGSLVSSGTATGGSTTTLEDLGADFVITDGVAIGDFLINDTQDAHGIITAVSATEITVNKMHDSGAVVTNANGDSYRVATSDDTGAAVISIVGLDANFDERQDHVILNGTTDVPSLIEYIRIFRLRVHLAGSSKTNEGTITAQNNASVVDLAQIGVGRGQTLMAQWTVPSDRNLFITQFTAGEQSNKGTEFVLLARPFGEAFQTKGLIYLIGSSFTKKYDIPLRFEPLTDIEMRSISGLAGGVVSADFDGWYEEEG